MLDAAVSTYLDAHRDEQLDALKQLLRIPSVANVSGQANACGRCANWLAEYLDKLGLAAEVLPTAGQPAVLAESPRRADRPTLLIYGHYDVQPAEPLHPWRSDPFEPEVREGWLYARGADDDKGQLFTHLMAVEAWLATSGELPVNVKLLLEGEEEVGSPNLEPFLNEHADRLRADAAVVSDSAFLAPGVPSITYALRGLTYVEIKLTGPSEDLHSGGHGGAVRNPLNALAALVAAMHDETGRVTIPGFYNRVEPLSDQERDAWAALPFDEAQYAANLGLDELTGGERGYSVLERLWARPTLDCNGMIGGYTAEGSKTVIPAEARAKISMRLVYDQDPAAVIDGLRRFLEAHQPGGTRYELSVYAHARAVRLAMDSPAMSAARAALSEHFGRDAAMIRCGASIPVVEAIQRILGLDAVLMGFGLPEDNLHAPNEKFHLEQLWRGSKTAATFLAKLVGS